MGGRSVSSGEYRYGFNGKERDQNGEWGNQTHYDYGFRIYNPGIARFLSVDPLSPKYPWYTPYQFAGNKPTWAIDVDGLEEALVNGGVNGTSEGQTHTENTDYNNGMDSGTITRKYVWHEGSEELGTAAGWYSEAKYKADIIGRIAAQHGNVDGLKMNPLPLGVLQDQEFI